MHSLIRILSRAQSAEEALQHVTAFADQFVERDEFDYYDLGSDRWEGTGRPHLLTTELGHLAVEEALRWNRVHFDRALRAVRWMLATFTDEQLYQDEFGEGPHEEWPSRHHFAVLAGETHDGFLYGDHTVWGGKIANETDYAAATRDLDLHELWVTAVDVHY